jgi:hypothetical protein
VVEERAVVRVGRNKGVRARDGLVPSVVAVGSGVYVCDDGLGVRTVVRSDDGRGGQGEMGSEEGLKVGFFGCERKRDEGEDWSA